ncbi:hypothetical protein MRB53_041896 [Persea americana]|nr:hypothetical protein MRB53_041896 [Persea americana]
MMEAQNRLRGDIGVPLKFSAFYLVSRVHEISPVDMMEMQFWLPGSTGVAIFLKDALVIVFHIIIMMSDSIKPFIYRFHPLFQRQSPDACCIAT